MDLLMEMQGVPDDQRHGDQGNEGEQSVHGAHEGNGQDQQDQDPEYAGQLFRQEVFGGINVRGTALDDITGFVFHVPGEGEMLDVGKQLVPHRFDQSLRGFGVVHPEGVVAEHLEYRNHQDGSCHDPQVLPEVRKAANGIYQIHHEFGIIRFLTAQGAVNSGPDDLGLEHIRQGRHTGSQNGHQKIAFCSFQELPQKREVFLLLGTCLIRCHERISPFPYFKSAGWVGPGELSPICKKGAGRSLRPELFRDKVSPRNPKERNFYLIHK